MTKRKSTEIQLRVHVTITRFLFVFQLYFVCFIFIISYATLCWLLPVIRQICTRVVYVLKQLMNAFICFMFSGEHRGGGIAGNARSSSERGRISAYSGASDHADRMDNPSSREDISEMYVLRICMTSPKIFSFNCFNPWLSDPYSKKIYASYPNFYNKSLCSFYSHFIRAIL